MVANSALLLVDIQNDFLPGGALPVPEGDRVVPIANQLQPRFALVVATQDWHPAAHRSFAANWPGRQVGDVVEVAGLEQILWPVHCVQDTPGAAFAPRLETASIRHVARKGTCPDADSYSGFFDNGHRHATGLDGYLREQEVTQLYVMGLATDYCVKFTVLDALELGYDTWLIEDGCRGVELTPGDIRNAVDAMAAAGAHRVTSDRVSPYMD